MSGEDPGAVIQAIRSEIDMAANAILLETEAGFADITLALNGEAAGLDRLRQRLSRILEACAFHDLTSQRLSVLTRLLASGATDTPTDRVIDPLLNGPALHGSGLDQAMADQLFAMPAVQPDAVSSTV